MSRQRSVLLIGIDPDAVDYTQEGAPPNAEVLRAAFRAAEDQLARRGDGFELCMIRPDASAERTVQARLAGNSYDCVLIGGGIRRPENLVLFETIINLVHRLAPAAALGFYPTPAGIAEAATRALTRDWQKPTQR